MNKINYCLSALAAMVIITGCGGNPVSNELDTEFFKRKIEGEITISAYETMSYRNYLEEAARAFETKYPGTKVNIETFSAMPEIRTGSDGNMQMSMIQMQNDPQSRADYLNRVNTNLMSGKGADIYAMDIIPLNKFINNGSLEDLDQYINLDPDFFMNDYRQNILNAVRYSDGIWFLPVDYTFNYFAYDSTLIPFETAAGFGVNKTLSTDDLLKIGIPLYDGSYRIFNATDFDRGANGLFSQLLNENMSAFIDMEKSRADFLNGGFSSLLASVRNYAELGYIPRAVTGQLDAGRVMRQAIDAPRDRFFFKLNNIFSLASQYMRSTGRNLMMSSAGSVMSYEDDDKIAGIQANSGGSVPFRYNHAFGINAASKNKETAWAFVKFLLSKEMQLSTNLNLTGLPVNNEARKEKIEMIFSGAVMGTQAGLSEQGLNSLREYLEVMETLSGLINSFDMRDTHISDMISGDVQFFVDGSRSADETARVIQNKVNLYLSE